MPKYSVSGSHSTFRGQPRFTLFSSLEKGQYFFSTDHCQLNNGEVPGDFVPVSFGLPQQIAPRPSLPDGIVATIEQYLEVFERGAEEIPNLNRRFQPA